MLNTLQFYPTPPSLAIKAWNKFENRAIRRLLEPSAGQGSLIDALHRHWADAHLNKPLSNILKERGVPYMTTRCQWDAIEMNPEFHPLLREKQAKIIGYDFLSFQHGAAYSHIIMNPPFAQGVHHVLHAWDILFTGEIVAIINAETVRNPYSKERQLLVRLIEQYGSVEYLQEEFTTEDTLRKTNVEVALVHLKKEAESNQDLLSYLDQLTQKESGSQQTVEGMQEVMLPNSLIQNAITNYNLAIRASVEAQLAISKASIYKNRLYSKEQTGSDEIDMLEMQPQQTIKELMSQEHESIHHNAWQMIINSSVVTSKLSRSTAKELESQLEQIYSLAFNATNIYGFLAGLAGQRGEIIKSMLLEVFDDITRYHSTNTCYYLGWKSNDKHRTLGRSIKMSRFILPLNVESWSRRSGVKTLQDIEATFLYLDGKAEATVSLPAMFEDKETYDRLAQGERITTDYFDIRYYPKRGSMHFFPRCPDLIRRFNVFIGKSRQWLPEDMHQASQSFIEQFDEAEKISKRFDLEKELKAYNSYDLARILSNEDASTMEKVSSLLLQSQEELELAYDREPTTALPCR